MNVVALFALYWTMAGLAAFVTWDRRKNCLPWGFNAVLTAFTAALPIAYALTA